MPGIEIIVAAFFGLCAIIGVAPHVKYEKPGATVISAGNLATFDYETGSVLSRNTFDVKAPSAINDESIKGGH
jgi:hypothetical protein